MLDGVELDAGSPAGAALALLTAAIDALQAVDQTRLTREELLALARGFETQKRRLPAVDHAVIHELESRGVARELACASTPLLLQQLLRLSKGEAWARFDAAAALGPRRALAGEALPPIYAAAAAAQAVGVISPAHAEVIVTTIEKLPDVVAKEHDVAVEATLVDLAAQFDPTTLAGCAQRITDTLDPDGALDSDNDKQRRRGVRIGTRRTGAGYIAGDLTPEALAVLLAVLSPLAAPKPEADGTKDPRTAEQRTHDALLDLANRVLNSGTLPDSAGNPTMLIVTVDADTVERGTGHGTSSHGVRIEYTTLRRMCDQARVVVTAHATAATRAATATAAGLDSPGALLEMFTQNRLATPSQRIALIARDGGCSFPGCTVPPEWCQAHHVVSWMHGGQTKLSNLTLVCGFHHREFEKRGWTCRMTDGIPEWIPPTWTDRTQTPRRNHMHHPAWR